MHPCGISHPRREALAPKAFDSGDIFLPTRYPNVAAKRPFCALHSEATELRVSGAGRVPRSTAKVPMGSALCVKIWICFRMLWSARRRGSWEIPTPEQGFRSRQSCSTTSHSDHVGEFKVGHVNLAPVHFVWKQQVFEACLKNGRFVAYCSFANLVKCLRTLEWRH